MWVTVGRGDPAPRPKVGRLRTKFPFVQDGAPPAAYGDGMNPNIFPALRYRDADAAIAFLRDAFGFEEKAAYRDDAGAVAHAELRLGAGLVMLGQLADHEPASAGQTIYVVVEDPDAHYARARAAGATILRELSDMEYGSREYGAQDLEGYRWSFGTYDPYAD